MVQSKQEHSIFMHFIRKAVCNKEEKKYSETSIRFCRGSEKETMDLGKQ
jgi:hypothetical protein